MKKALFLLVAFSIFATAFAATSVSVLPKKATEIYLPIGNNKQISLMELSVIKVNDYEKITGKHLNFFQKISFKAGQKKLRKSIASDGTITNKKLAKAMQEGGAVGFNGGWFALGFLLGLIGVVLSYVINGDEAVKKNRQKWAWIGLGAAVVVYLLILLL